MNFLNVILSIFILTAVGCAEMGLKPHKPNMKSTLEIAKSAGTFRVLTVKGATPEITTILNGDLMSCGTTTFSMPRGNTVATFVREVFEQELVAAKKLSDTGAAIEVLIKSINLETTTKESGEWTVEIDYTMDDKTTSVKTIIEFESKVSLLTSCTHTASVFEDALADNFVDFFKRTRKN